MGDLRSISRAQWLRLLALRRPHKTAFVLSGGGPFGAVQVGMLKALLERDVRPDLCVGTSAGALNAVFLAFDPTSQGVDRLSRIWNSLGDEDLFPGARFKTSWARMLMRGNKVFENSGLRRLIETRLGRARFEDAQIPLAVVATELETGSETVFHSGDLMDPLLASSAMPGIFPPVEIAGRLFIDGGVANSVPIGPAIEMGAKKIFVLNCIAKTQPPRPLIRPMDHLLHAFSLARSKRFELEKKIYAPRVDLVIVEPPRLDFTVPFTSMRYTAELERIGYETMVRRLDGDAVAEMPAPSEAPPTEVQGIVTPAESSS
ncbi:MAG: patatin-like phospholipase family protein [Actinomycetota bacterium]